MTPACTAKPRAQICRAVVSCVYTFPHASCMVHENVENTFGYVLGFMSWMISKRKLYIFASTCIKEGTVKM